MKTTHRRVLVTGATGTWGLATLDVLLDQGLSVLALVLPSPGDLDKIAPFLGRRGLQVIYGDVRDANLLKRLVTQVDVILHLAAVISPLADEQPEVTRQVNVGGAGNVIAAVRSLPDPSVVDVVMCGSVAEYGDRLPPVHWARVGDPLAPSQFDHYGQSKVAAERLLVESGLPRWIWLRQTGILHAGLVNTRDPIITHSPLAGVLEWTSDVNSAHLLAQLASETTPDELWGRVHNIGDGAGWRFTNFELQQHLLDTLQVFDQRKWFERRWFATKNFHGVWYTDSQRLQQLVPYRVETFDEALRRCAQQAGALSRLAHLVPSWIVRRCIMRPQVYRSPRGTMSWVRDDNTDYLAAFFGSRQEWERIGSWDTFVPVEPSNGPSLRSLPSGR